MCVASHNALWAKAPGNVRLSAQESGLPRDAVVNVSQIVTLDRSRLSEHVGRIGAPKLDSILAGIDLSLGR
jgi:mRNA interferase MazF